MNFLHPFKKEKIVRTILYGDQEFSHFELEILHTPMFQRLYNLKQLGFSDKIFPDAVHSRFNHVLGVPHLAEKMAQRLVRWLHKHADVRYEYLGRKSASEYELKTVSASELAGHLEQNLSALRLAGLLHDLTHAAFGHTLEDELQAFEEKHDEPPRQARFFDTLVAQLVALWSIEAGNWTPRSVDLDHLLRQDVDKRRTLDQAEELRYHVGEDLPKLVQELSQLEFALKLLLLLARISHHASR